MGSSSSSDVVFEDSDYKPVVIIDPDELEKVLVHKFKVRHKAADLVLFSSRKKPAVISRAVKSIQTAFDNSAIKSIKCEAARLGHSMLRTDPTLTYYNTEWSKIQDSNLGNTRELVRADNERSAFKLRNWEYAGPTPQAIEPETSNSLGELALNIHLSYSDMCLIAIEIGLDHIINTLNIPTRQIVRDMLREDVEDFEGFIRRRVIELWLKYYDFSMDVSSQSVTVNSLKNSL